MAQATNPVGTGIQNFFNAFNASSNAAFRRRQLEIQQAIADRRISVQEGTLLLNQEKFNAEQANQQTERTSFNQAVQGLFSGNQQTTQPQNISAELAQVLGSDVQGNIDPTSARGGLADTSQLQIPETAGDLSVSRAPLTQSMLDEEKQDLVSLLGFSGGTPAFQVINPVLQANDPRQIRQLRDDTQETLDLARNIQKAKTRQEKNTLIDDAQSKQILDTGQINQELLNMKNMDDEELEGEMISDLEIGNQILKIADRRLGTDAEVLLPGQKPRGTAREQTTPIDRLLDDELAIRSQFSQTQQGRNFLTAINPAVTARRAERTKGDQETFTPVFDSKGNIVGQRSSKTRKVVADPRTTQETFTPVLDNNGNIIGQRSSTTGRVVADPRVQQETFAPVFDNDGNIIGQKSSTTGQLVTDPRTQKTGTGVHTLPDGSTITNQQLLSQYKLENNLLDEIDIKILEATNKERAAIERDRASNAIPFAEWALQTRGIDIRGGFQPQESREIDTPPIALPETQNQLIVGQRYNTNRGLAVWNGRMFESLGGR